MIQSVSKIVLLVLLVLTCYALPAQQPTIQLAQEVSNYDIGLSTTYFEDKAGTLTLNQILAKGGDGLFVPMPSDVLVAGITTSAFWVKIVAQNQQPSQGARWILTLDYPPLDTVVFYQQDSTGQWLMQESGDRYPFRNRAIPHYKFAFALPMPDTLPHTYYLNVKTGGSVVIGAHLESEKYFVEDSLVGSIGYGIFVGALVIMLFYNLFLYFSLKDISYLAYVFFIINNLVMQLCYSGHISQYVFPDNPSMANLLLPVSVALTPLTAVFFTTTFLNTSKFTPVIHKLLLFVGAFAVVNFFIAVFLSAHTAGLGNSVNISLLLLVTTVAGVANLLKGNKSARFFLLAWSFLILGGSITTLKSFGVHFPNFIARNGTMISSLIELALLSVALADKYNLFKKEKDEAQREILKLNENAKRVLEQKVKERTAELHESLATLKTTQAQLIQKEKLASLGELTAGIAHEIQNPLNLANNFSEVSEELTVELQQELNKGSIEEAKILSEDLVQNLKKINHHGKRASSIVRGMLEHSMTSSGVSEETDINALATEYLRLSYHKMKSKNKAFDVEVACNFQEAIPKTKVVAQDIGRVIMNILDNAFYAVASVPAKPGDPFKPVITLSTRVEEGRIVIAIGDNGPGMTEKVRAKVFDPFYTTKPTGEGNTGLGLSLAYDIVVKGHGGNLDVQSTEGAGAIFEVRLPI